MARTVVVTAATVAGIQDSDMDVDTEAAGIPVALDTVPTDVDTITMAVVMRITDAAMADTVATTVDSPTETVRIAPDIALPSVTSSPVSRRSFNQLLLSKQLKLSKRSQRLRSQAYLR